MKEILKMIITNLTEKKQNVEIEEVINEKEILFNVTVDESDKGKVIGKQGRIAKSIRVLIKAIAMKEGKKVNIEFK